MRKPLVAGNWKMNVSRCELQLFVESIVKESAHYSSVDIALFPSFVHLPQVEKLIQNSPIKMGGQNLYLGASGAFTGEVSGQMLADYGCSMVLVGHSERRIIFKEDLDLVAAKLKAALEFGLQPVLCVGETLEQREQGKTEQVIYRQIESILREVPIETFKKVIIAYEPVWAIGTDKTATPDQAQEIHAMIRNLLAQYDKIIADEIRILYGGSVKADNAKHLFEKPDIDGGLVGGASLDAKSFLAICEAASLRRLCAES